MYKLIINHDISIWHMKVRVIRVFRVPDCDTRITRNKFGFCKLLPEIPEQNSGFGYFGFGFGYSGFGFRVTGFLPSPSWTVRVQIEWLPIQSRVVILFMSTGSEGWQTGPYMRGQSFCSHLNQLSHHLRPSPKLGSPWSSHSQGDEGEYPSSHSFGKHRLVTITAPFRIPHFVLKNVC
jgi:hypothetical protein